MKKTKLIPIEVLRVEDKIFGSLTLAQVGLLAIPLGAAAILLLCPPAGRLPIYKLAIIGLSFAVSGLLAVRLNGRLVISWLLLIARYNARPKRYLAAPGPAKAAPANVPALQPRLDVKKFVPAKTWRPPLVPIKQIVFKPRARAGRKNRREE